MKKLADKRAYLRKDRSMSGLIYISIRYEYYYCGTYTYNSTDNAVFKYEKSIS